jgi:hypothetical protein
MADGDGDGNGRWQWGRQQQWLMATRQRWRRQWLTVTTTATTAMAMGNCNGDGNGVGDGVGDGDGDGNDDGNSNGLGEGNHYKGRVASSCGGNVQHFWMGNTLLPPPWTQGKCIHQRCVMGVTLLRVFAPLQERGFLTAHHRLFFVYFLQLLLVY